MYILFNRLIFDTEDLIVAQASECGLHLHFSGDQNPVRIWCGEDEAEAMLQELFAILQGQGMAASPEDGPYAELGPVELDDDEMQALDAAAELGYRWIARDKNGKIYCYQRQPEKVGSEYQDAHTPDPRRIDPDWFSEITFEVGPVSIDYLRLDA